MAGLSGLPIRGFFLGGKPLKLMSWLGAQKKTDFIIDKIRETIVNIGYMLIMIKSTLQENENVI